MEMSESEQKIQVEYSGTPERVCLGTGLRPHLSAFGRLQL